MQDCEITDQTTGVKNAAPMGHTSEKAKNSFNCQFATKTSNTEKTSMLCYV